MPDDAPKPQQWYFSTDGRRQGPFTSKQLRAEAAVGRLKPDHMVWKEGMAAWAKASKVRGLFASAVESHAASPVEPVISDEVITDWLGESHRPSPRADVEIDSSPPVFTPSDSETKACPYCGETILAVARKCKHCGEFLDDSKKKPGRVFFKASGDFIGLMCSYHVMDENRKVLAKLKPNQSFEVPISSNTTMYVLYSCGFAGAVEVKCRAHEVNRFSICLSQMGMGCVVSRVDLIDSD
jgi:hypothetical protein